MNIQILSTLSFKAKKKQSAPNLSIKNGLNCCMYIPSIVCTEMIPVRHKGESTPGKRVQKFGGLIRFLSDRYNQPISLGVFHPRGKGLV